MNRLSDCEPAALTVDLRTRTAPELRAAVQDTITSGGPVYLDALEDVANYEPAAFRVLEQQLTTAGGPGIPWRLACRPAAWDANLAAALEGMFPGFRELNV